MSKPTDPLPEPIRGSEGANIIGPRNPDRERQDPDMVRPPAEDHGTMPNMKWSFADSHTRIEPGGWARQTTVRELPTSVELAGVNMRLDEGAIRELHWHQEAEWAYMLEGRCRIHVLDLEGGTYTADLEKGDLWYFPTGRPHSLQGLGKGGCEFLLIFDDGNFSEDSTFLLTDWLAHVPREVLVKNFRQYPELFDALPAKEKYIFRGTDIGGPAPPDPQPSKYRFSHKMLAQTPLKFDGGEVRITDTSVFPVSKTVSAAHVILKPRAMRELHWHPNADEWSYFIRGRARVSVFASGGTSRTFNYVAGDVGIVPRNMGHYVENLSDTEEVEFLEVFKSDKFEDFSLEQWLAKLPNNLVAEHLNLKGEDRRKFLDGLDKEKKPVKAAAKL